MKTSLYTILCIALRLGAILWAIETIVALPNLYFLAHAERASSDTVPLMALLYLASLVAAFVLWLYPDVLARFAAGKSTNEVFESPISAHDIQYVALSVLGMSFAVKGLIAIAFEVFRWRILAAQTLPGDSLLPTELPRIASASAQLLLGIVLALGSKGLSGLLDRLRYGNTAWERP